MDAITQWGLDFIIALQQAPWLIAPMRLFTVLGTEDFFMLLMPALVWSIDSRLGLRVAVVLIGSNALNSLLKLAFHGPRPYWIDNRVQAWSTETSYGSPSGHAQNGLAVWGYLASQAQGRLRRLGWVLALALVALISLSRLHLGVHFPHDVAVGLLAGGLWLWAVLRWEAPATRWLSRQALVPQILLALLVAVLYLALALALTAAFEPAGLAEWESAAAAASPPEPGETAIDPRGVDTPASNAGMLFGLGAALACATRWARFDAGGHWSRRAARYLIGAFGILIVWRGLALVFPAEPLAIGMFFRFVRYALVVYWALFLAPWVFLKLGLAQPASAAAPPRAAAGAVAAH